MENINIGTDKFPDLSISCQNVLSLNVSSKSSKTDLKILAITKKKSDVILLSDTRLNTNKQSAALHDLTKKFLLKGYNFIYNSKQASRGVAILIKKSLAWNIHRKICDNNDNYLILDISISGKRFTLAAVYGPNNDDLAFYDRLAAELQSVNNTSIVVGGDWNATWDPSPIHNNIDAINMANIPSKRRSEKINSIARNLSLTDPYRYLYLTRREYTFIPNIAGNRNRFRLDFFLVSKNIVNYCKSVNIPHNLSSKTFDHKCVEICFQNVTKKKPQTIKDTILKDPLLEIVMRAYTFDCYNNHAMFSETFTAASKDSIARKIGIILTEVQNIQNAKFDLVSGLVNDEELILNRIDLMENRISNLFRELPNLQYFENLNIELEYDIFFETLAICLKNHALSFQSSFYKGKNAQKKFMTEQIQNLKQRYAENSDRIFELEQRLSTIVELELKEELALVKNFERLNDEKITPYFLKLAKTPEITETLEALKNTDSSNFENSTEREEHIVSYYKELYKIPTEPEQFHNKTIEEFLGNAALEEEVINSKLSNDEKKSLEIPLSIDELDASINKAKLNSAPGIDGISKRFIKEFWEFLRVPLHGYAMCCFEKGELTSNFRSSKIRLIPKKGDCSKIKNWRPISLLNCFYKIISRAIAERLKRVIGKITNVGQKGYNSSKQCQEVLITLIDEIQTAKFL